MKKHITVVGALNIGFGILWMIGAIILYFVFNFAKGVVDNDEIAVRVIGFIGLILPILIGVISVIGLIGGIALLSYQSWARVMVIIISVLGCLNIPIGTLLGVYSIWVLMQDETVKLFEKKL